MVIEKQARFLIGLQSVVIDRISLFYSRLVRCEATILGWELKVLVFSQDPERRLGYVESKSVRHQKRRITQSE
jgi:hypothetical protein